jgi:hypothetical protein
MGPSFYSVLELSVATSFPLAFRTNAAPSAERLHAQGLAAGTEKRQLSDKIMSCRLLYNGRSRPVNVSTPVIESQQSHPMPTRCSSPPTPPDRHPRLIIAQLLNKSPTLTQLDNSLPGIQPSGSAL